MNSYIPLLAVQQRNHPIGYEMPVREYRSGAEATAASQAARNRLRGHPLLSAPKPISRALLVAAKAKAKVRMPHDTLDVSLPPVETAPSTAYEIIREVCIKYGLTKPELFSARRRNPLPEARHEAMYRMSKETQLSLPAIGRKLGGRDHTTVIHGIRKHTAQLRGEVYVKPTYGKARQAEHG